MKQLLTIGFLFGLAVSNPLEARTFSIPAKSGEPGTEISLPVYFDNASGCASIQLEINYDVGVLEFTGFETGSGLGSQFEPTSFAENGVVTLIWTRATSLSSGSGCLGWLNFQINSGAELGSLVPVTIANHETSDETGVVDLSLTESFTAVSGMLLVSNQEMDGDSDGIPDTWESANLLDPNVSNVDVDTDSDGRTDFLEYAFGGDPQAADPGRSPLIGVFPIEGSEFLSLTFSRRQFSPLIYRVWASTDLSSWEEVAIEPNLIGSPLDQGDGTERVTVRSGLKIAGSNADSAGFMKIEVERP